MSFEENVELRDLIAQTLEQNGALSLIRANLRANVFHTLFGDSETSNEQPCLNTKIKSQLEEPQGKLIFCLVREFLEYFNLDYTMSVYEPESYLGTFYKYEGRQKIIEDLGLTLNDPEPVLLHLVKIAQMKAKTLKINLTHLNGGEESASSSVPSLQINGHSADENSGNIVKKPDQIKENGVQTLDSTYNKKDMESDDTCNGTSSIEEETINSFEHDASQKTVTKDESESEPKSKSKSDKLKSKLEVPPVDLNKSHRGDLLPSLYCKVLEEKRKEFDFEIEDDYEEDFMSGSEIDLSLETSKPLFEELKQCSGITLSPSDSTKSKYFAKPQNAHNSNADNKTDDVETGVNGV